MTERPTGSHVAPVRPESPAEAPPPDVVAFMRFCHARRPVGWPELYDEMCAVAARREFRGWGYDDLAGRGVTFALPDMPRLAAWVRAVLATLPSQRPERSGAQVGREPMAGSLGEAASPV